jgi:hypothetical protein
MNEYLQFKIMKLKYLVLILLIMKQNLRTTCLEFAWKFENNLLGIFFKHLVGIIQRICTYIRFGGTK